jgi:hypothetical protein
MTSADNTPKEDGVFSNKQTNTICARMKLQMNKSRSTYPGWKAHDLPLLLDSEGEGGFERSQEVFGMARNQLINDGDSAILTTWDISSEYGSPL